MRRISARYEYDERLAQDLAQQSTRWAAIRSSQPQWKRDLQTARAGKRLAARAAARMGNTRVDREEAEARAAEAVKRAITILEMAVMELNGIRAPKVYQKQINSQQVHNAIFLLKTKCGISFAPDEFTHKVSLDRAHLADD